MRYVLFLIVGFLGIWGYLFYHPTVELKVEPKETKEKQVTLIVGKDLQKIFPNIKTPQQGEALNKTFHSMNETGNLVCDMIYSRMAFDYEIYNSFTTISNKGYLSKLILGCHNFFRMNDVYLIEMLRKINSIYGNQEKDCYSVGFAQLYLMGTEIKCTSLTAIDVDWRILWAHFQFLESYSQGNLVNFPGLNIGWSADYAGQIKKVEPHIKPETFCYSTDIAKCKKAFRNFDYNKVTSFNLQLSFLHQIQLINKNKLVLFYVSNAIDPGYTSESQFKELLENLKNSIDYIQKVVVVYHGGGSKQFGIYELKRISETDSLSVTTVCRDDYVWSPSYSTRGQHYETYFDKVSVLPEAEPCSPDEL